MRINSATALVFAATYSTLSYAQTGVAFVGGGYGNPSSRLTAAAGQVISIFVRGLGNKITQKVLAPTGPLPTKLAGISVTMVQDDTPLLAPLQVPLLAVYPTNTCGYGGPGCDNLLGIMVQIPFELIFDYNPNARAFRNLALARLQISDGISSVTATLVPAADLVHILRAGDTITAQGDFGLVGPTDLFPPIVTHADGSLVGPSNPAKVGEEVVMYAVGLGNTDPPVRTGDPSPLPAAKTLGSFTLSFEYRPNARAYNPFIGGQTFGFPGSPPPASPLFVGLVPGAVGLYQVNFQVPPPAAGVPACVDATSAPGSPPEVLSNLTVTLIGAPIQSGGSFDGVGMCVEPTVAPPPGQ